LARYLNVGAGVAYAKAAILSTLNFDTAVVGTASDLHIATGVGQETSRGGDHFS
jgi:hypothetical protein